MKSRNSGRRAALNLHLLRWNTAKVSHDLAKPLGKALRSSIQSLHLFGIVLHSPNRRWLWALDSQHHLIISNCETMAAFEEQRRIAIYTIDEIECNQKSLLDV